MKVGTKACVSTHSTHTYTYGCRVESMWAQCHFSRVFKWHEIIDIMCYKNISIKQVY